VTPATAPDRSSGRGVGTDASLTAIIDCVALPVWVVDHARLVVLSWPSCAAATDTTLSTTSIPMGRRIGRGLPNAGTSRTASPCTETRTGIRRDGTMFPVSFTRGADRPRDRGGVGLGDRIGALDGGADGHQPGG
jgi:hypothetical protein